MGTQIGAVAARRPGALGRLAALDGLRGLAALVVVLHHCAMTHPAFAQAMLRPREPLAQGSTVWWLTRTPAYILVAGHEAVFIFFVLSGLVLTLPRLKPEPDPWRAYYPARLVRLYLPVVAAVLVAAVTFRLVPRHIVPGDGVWLAAAASHYSGTDMVRDMLLLAFVSGAVSPLWSLTHEMWFSLLLPLYAWAATRWRGAPWSLLAITVVALGVLTGRGSGSPLFRLQYLATFALGVAVAVRLPAIHAWVGEREKNRGGHAGLLVLLVLAVLLVCLRQELQGLGVDILVAERLDSLVIVGCALLLVVVTMTGPGGRVLESRPAQLLGSISFSLYLLHEPLVIATRELLRGQPWWLVWITAVPASLVMALVFRVLVEEPSHQLARRVRTRARALAPAQARPELAP